MSIKLNAAKTDAYSSYLSRPTLLSDLPEVSNVVTEFIYNYFKSDERITEAQTGDTQGPAEGIFTFTGLLGSQQEILSNMTGQANSDLYKFYGKNSIYPRFVKVTFSPPSGPQAKNLQPNDKIRLRNQLSTIQRENAASVFSRYAIEITDTAEDGSFYKISRYAANNSIDIISQLGGANNTEPGNEFNRPFLNSLNSVIQAEGYNFVKDDRVSSNPATSAIKGIQNSFSILPQVAQDILDGSLQSMKNVYMDEIQYLIDSARRVQENAKASEPYKVRTTDFDAELPDFSIRTPGGGLQNYLVGYIIQKFSINEDGTVKIYPEILIDSPDKRTFIDVDICYGRRYRYRVLGLFLSEFEAIIDTDGQRQNKVIGTLFTSQGTDALVDCFDKVAPPPPVDLKFKYRADESGLTIMWNFPVNLQNDIAKFQVFRRRSVLDPFELIKEYNFDSSIEPTYSPEFASNNLVQKVNLPVTIHRDTTFTKDSKFIYAVASVDAHGLTSNYSVQLEVSYDRYRNKLNTRLISPSDAPKPYPNIFINNDTFVDAMRMSGYTKLNIYFDPEYVKVTAIDGETSTVTDLNHILFNAEGTNNLYKLMVTNTDFQESRTLDIKINNRYNAVQSINVSTAKVFDPS